MNALLRALLLRNRYCAPVGGDGELPGGAAAGDAEESQDDGSAAADVNDDAGEEQDSDAANDGDDGTGDTQAEVDEDLVITLEGQDLADEEDEVPAGIEPKASAAFAKMRADKKRLERENRELKARQEEAAARAQQPAAAEPLGPEPTMEDADVDFDAEKFADKYKGWVARKAEHDARQKEAEADQRQQQDAWQKRLDAYKVEAGKLKKADFDDAESAVKASFNTVQQGLLLKHPTAAALVYVLGKNPARAKTLSAIADPVDFAYAAADLASHVKVERKSPPPPTDTPVRGRTTGAALASQTLEGLKEQGRRTGDYSPYFNAKRAAEARKAKAAA
jgi:hypothetical protein